MAFRLPFFVTLFVACALQVAHAETRVALVVGNSTYRQVPSLANPANDARLMADTLAALGFKLVGGEAQLNLDKAAFDRAVQDFGARLQGADVGLFYYAGHGVQIHGTNFLVPVSANPKRAADADFQMLDTNLVLRQMESAGTRLNLVILDACRNNPFGGRGLRALSTGLAQMQAPEGTLISFATQPGNVAQDGNGQHSPFSQALSAAMRKRGLGLFETFNEVGLEVKRSTGGVQQPWLSSSPIAGNFYFAGRPGQAAPAKDAGMNEREVAALEERLKALEQKLNERRETKFADVSPQARPIAPKPHTPMISLESLAQNFLADYMRHSEGSLDEVLAYVQNTYATEVDYFGDHMSNRKVAADQRRYVTKWPQRSFRRKPETTRIVCNKASSSCRVSGELEFNVANPATAKTSAGVATYEFQVVFAAGGAKIVSENGRVMSRRN